VSPAEIAKREVQRAMSGVRGAFRGLLSSMQLDKRVQLVTLDGLAGEKQPDVELMQQFGFTSAPPVGSQVIVLPLGGRSSASVIVATENGNYRFKVTTQGEVALYNQWGDRVYLNAARQIEITSQSKVTVNTQTCEVNASAAMTITTPQLNVSNNVSVGGTLTAAVDVVGGGKSLKTHVHSGVQPGGSNTGGPV
jgi:phage baseplate assembly protein V